MLTELLINLAVEVTITVLVLASLVIACAALHPPRAPRPPRA
jgi:hypothetical protein